MGLTVASMKLQAIVEESSRRKSLINSDKLKVVEGAVLGSGASATVFRGSYRDADVAVKAFKPVELTDEDVRARRRGRREDRARDRDSGGPAAPQYRVPARPVRAAADRLRGVGVLRAGQSSGGDPRPRGAGDTE